MNTRTPRIVVLLTAVALLVCFAPTLRGMADQWYHDQDMGHGFLVPVAIGWIVWRERPRWRNLRAEPSRAGFLILAAGAGMQLASALSAGLFAGSVGFVFSLAGAIVCLGGFAWLRVWAFPMLLTLFMLPKLAIVYNQGTLPLQLLATKMAGGMLSAGGFKVMREGTILNVSGHPVSVVAACDGIRYLLPLAFLAVVLAYITDTSRWMRPALLAAAVLVAVAANALRVAAAAAVPALAEGTAHAVSGLLIFGLCLPALLTLRRIFHSVYTRLHV